MSGSSFDVITRCGGEISGSTESGPIALIEIALPEVDITVQIAIDVDRYHHSLLAAVRSGKFALFTPATAHSLQTEPIPDALHTTPSMLISLADTKPLMGLLQQRVNLPLAEYRPVLMSRDEYDSQDEMIADFLDGACIPMGIAIQYRDTGTPSIVLIDSAAPDRASSPTAPPLAGRWRVMASEKRAALRLDSFDVDVPFRSWVIADPDPLVIRAGSAGSHHVMILTEPLSSDQHSAEKQWASGVSIWVEHVEALRSLLPRLEVDDPPQP